MSATGKGAAMRGRARATARRVRGNGYDDQRAGWNFRVRAGAGYPAGPDAGSPSVAAARAATADTRTGEAGSGGRGTAVQ